MAQIAILVLLTLLPYATGQKCSQYVTDMRAIEAKSYASDEIGFYTRGMSVVMRFMIGEIKQKTAQEMGNIIKDPSNTHEYVWSIFTNHPFITTVFVILIISTIVLFISLIITFACRWYNPDTKGLTPSNSSMCCTLFVFVFCGTICAGGALIFFMSIKGVKDGMEDIDTNLKSTSGQLSTFVDSYHKVMECLTKDQNINLQTAVNTEIGKIDAEIDSLRKRIEDAKQQGLTIQAIPSLPEQSSTEITKVTQQLDNVLIDVNSINADVNKILNDARTAYKNSYDALLKVIAEVEKGFKTMEKRLISIMTENNYYSGTMSTVMQCLFIIPLILCGIMAFAFVILFVRFMKNCSQENQEERRGPLSVFAGHLLGVTGYIAMLTGVLLFSLAAATFLIAFVSMFFCMGFFDDPNLAVFKFFPSLQTSLGSITIHEAFVRCKNEYPFLDAIDGDKQLAKDILATVYSDIASKDFCQAFRHFSIGSTFLSNLDLLSKTLSGQDKSNLDTYCKLLYDLDARAYRDQLCLAIDGKLIDALKELTNVAADQMNSIFDLSPQCDSMIKIWNNAGSFICNGISMPAQGAWMACLICGVGSYIVFIWMFKSTKYLKNFDDYDDEKNSDVEEGKTS